MAIERAYPGASYPGTTWPNYVTETFPAAGQAKATSTATGTVRAVLRSSGTVSATSAASGHGIPTYMVATLTQTYSETFSQPYLGTTHEMDIIEGTQHVIVALGTTGGSITSITLNGIEMTREERVDGLRGAHIYSLPYDGPAGPANIEVISTDTETTARTWALAAYCSDKPLTLVQTARTGPHGYAEAAHQFYHVGSVAVAAHRNDGGNWWRNPDPDLIYGNVAILHTDGAPITVRQNRTTRGSTFVAAAFDPVLTEVFETSSLAEAVSRAYGAVQRLLVAAGVAEAFSQASGQVTNHTTASGRTGAVSTVKLTATRTTYASGSAGTLSTASGDPAKTTHTTGATDALSTASGEMQALPKYPAYPGVPYPLTTWPSYATEETFPAAGQAKATSAASGTVTARLRPTGRADALSMADGSPSTIGAPQTYSGRGTSVATSTSSGSIHRQILVARGTSGAISDPTGTVTAKVTASGAVNALVSAIGEITSKLLARGAQTALSGGAGEVSQISTSSGATHAESDTSGDPSAIILVAGTSATESRVSGSASLIDGPQVFNVSGSTHGQSGASITGPTVIFRPSQTVAASSTASGRATSVLPTVGHVAGSVGQSGDPTAILRPSQVFVTVSTARAEAQVIAVAGGAAEALSGASGNTSGKGTTEGRAQSASASSGTVSVHAVARATSDPASSASGGVTAISVSRGSLSVGAHVAGEISAIFWPNEKAEATSSVRLGYYPYLLLLVEGLSDAVSGARGRAATTFRDLDIQISGPLGHAFGVSAPRIREMVATVRHRGLEVSDPEVRSLVFAASFDPPTSKPRK